MKRILVPTDFSEHAENALHFAAQIARRSNDTEILLGARNGLYLCDLKDGKVIPNYHHPYLRNNKVNDIQPNKFQNGFIISTEEEGLFFYKNSQSLVKLKATTLVPPNLVYPSQPFAFQSLQ